MRERFSILREEADEHGTSRVTAHLDDPETEKRTPQEDKEKFELASKPVQDPSQLMIKSNTKFPKV